MRAAVVVLCGSIYKGLMPHDESTLNPESPRKPWVAPTLTSHASLTALTQVQSQQNFGVDTILGGPQLAAIPCSQGFCP